MIPPSKSGIPLIDAALAGDLAAIKAFIAQGADLEVKDEEGQTPLYALISNLLFRGLSPHPELLTCAEALLAAGANPFASRGQDGRDVLYLAVTRHSCGLVKILKTNEMKISSSCSLIEFIESWSRCYFRSEVEECKAILKLLLEEQPDLNQRTDDEHQRTALHLACRSGHHDAILILLEAGCDPQSLDGSGCNPLVDLTNYAWRSQTDCLFSIYALIRCGADVNCLGTGPSEESPLHWLTIYGGNRLAVVTLLLESGADPNKPNNKGKTALIHAAESDRIDLIQVLLLFGAKVEHRDNQGLTALDHARIDNRQRVIDVLLKNNGPEEGRAVRPVDEPFQLRSLSG
ncbi:MAG: ankyrin repeat domain-containing protein [Chlorobium sp.]|nr:ankyrin repeat domain-containing protein [Chlorobium sp.]